MRAIENGDNVPVAGFVKEGSLDYLTRN